MFFIAMYLSGQAHIPAPISKLTRPRCRVAPEGGIRKNAGDDPRSSPQALNADRARIERGRLERCVAFQGGCVIPFAISYFNYSSTLNSLIFKHLMEHFTCQAFTDTMIRCAPIRPLLNGGEPPSKNCRHQCARSASGFSRSIFVRANSERKASGSSCKASLSSF